MTENIPGSNGQTVEIAADQAEVISRNFNFFYGKFQALKDVNVSIPRQRVTALIGSSGCGKSTFLRCMTAYRWLGPKASCYCAATTSTR